MGDCTLLATRSGFITGVVPLGAFPQGLKPEIILLLVGTAETVPFQNQVIKQLLGVFLVFLVFSLETSRSFTVLPAYFAWDSILG
jgi:hypothetical protein